MNMKWISTVFNNDSVSIIKDWCGKWDCCRQYLYILIVSWGQCHFKIRKVGSKDPGLFMCLKKNYNDTPYHMHFW